VPSPERLTYRLTGRINGFLPFGVRDYEEEFRMVVVTPRRFLMGVPLDHPERRSGERPRWVDLQRPFALGETLVAESLYVALVRDGRPDSGASSLRPIVHVSWYDAVRFCNALSVKVGLQPSYDIGAGDPPYVRLIELADGFRLPDESEWECAARAGECHPQGWGLSDMVGNMSQWCGDPFVGASEPGHDPAFRVLRGGLSRDSARPLSAWERRRYHAGARESYIGFRLARTVM
jgi:formylglycine-generating enzyme required for sulfatase activity